MVEIVEKMYCIDKIDMVDLVVPGTTRRPHSRKEVSTATNERKATARLQPGRPGSRVALPQLRPEGEPS